MEKIEVIIHKLWKTVRYVDDMWNIRGSVGIEITSVLDGSMTNISTIIIEELYGE